MTLCLAAYNALSNEDAFDSIATIAGKGAITIEPLGNPQGSERTYYAPEGSDVSVFLDELENNITNEDIPIFYYNMEFKPTRWGVYIDQDYHVIIHAVDNDGQAVEVYPNTDSWYQYASSNTKQNKADDIEAATAIALAVQETLTDESAFDDIYAYVTAKEIVIASAKPGEPFRSTVDSPVSIFLNKLNNSLGGKAPIIKHLENSSLWIPKEWQITLTNSKPLLRIYISDGTDKNKVELYPEIDDSYKH